MKKILLSLAGAAILLSGTMAMADTVQIITDQFYSVGRAYDASGNQQPSTSTYFPTSSQDLGTNTYVAPDGKTDSFDVGNLLRIRNLTTGTDIFTETVANGITFVVSGSDDVLFDPSNPIPGFNATLYSLGLHIDVYTDTPPDFDPTNPSTASNGTLLLSLDGTDQTISNASGYDLTAGNTFDLVENYNYNTNQYGGYALLDVVGGSWASLFDTNTQSQGADIAFSFSLNDISNAMVGQFDLSGTANGIGAVPEPTTMLLFGAGLIGLAGVGRKKLRK